MHGPCCKSVTAQKGPQLNGPGHNVIRSRSKIKNGPLFATLYTRTKGHRVTCPSKILKSSQVTGPCHAAPMQGEIQSRNLGHFEFFLDFVTMRFASLGPNGQSLKKSKQSTQAARKQGLQIAVAVACWNAKSLQQSAIFPKQPCEDPNLVPGTPLMRSKQ